MTGSESRPPVPPFTLETATQKVEAAEDASNSRDPKRVAFAYTVDSEWRNRDERRFSSMRHPAAAKIKSATNKAAIASAFR